MSADRSSELSIIIISYNVQEDIARCLESLASSREHMRLEMVVIDNASSDDSASYIRDRYPWVSLIENEVNIGFAAAVNQGIGHTIGDYVLLLNPDTEVCPGTLERMLEFMNTNSSCGICGGSLLNPDGTPQESTRSFPSPSTLLAESFFLKKFIASSTPQNKPHEVDVVVGACLMARRTMIQEIGGMDEQFFLYSEEVDWCLRARQQNWMVYTIPEAGVIHGLERSSVDHPGASFVELYRSRALYMRKHFSVPGRWITHMGLFTGVCLRLFIWGGAQFFTKDKEKVRKKFVQNHAVFSWYITGRPNPHNRPSSTHIHPASRSSSERPHIIFITSVATGQRSDAKKKLSRVGTYYYIEQALQRHCGRVTYIGPARLKSEFLGKMCRKIIRMLSNKTYDYEHSLWLSRRYARLLQHQLIDHQGDVIFAPFAATEIAHLETDLPIVYLSDATFDLLNNYYPEYENLTSRSERQAREVEAMAIHKARQVVYPSHWAAQSAIEDYGADGAKVHVVPFGANIDEAPPEEVALRRTISDHCRLLFLGVNWERKGGDIAFDTLISLEELGLQTELIVCGCTPPEGKTHPHMQVYPFLDKNDPQQRQHFNDLLQTSHFLLLPTRCECYGIVFCEANAFGLPVVATDTGGVSEVIRHGENGFLLPPNAGGVDYAKIIYTIYQDESQYTALVRNSRKAFDERLNWDQWAAQMAPLIKQTIDEHIKAEV